MTKWPEKPTCHVIDPIFKMSSIESCWREPRRDGEPYGEDFRTCYFCGSIHPEDLLRHLNTGASLHGSDWKYGTPHKFYVQGIKNLHPQSKLVECGSKTENGISVPIMSPPPPTVHAKWYNDHLMDTGYDEEALQSLLTALGGSGIEFTIENGNVKYKAPYAGYQK